MAALAAAVTDDAYEQNDSFSAAANLGTLSAPKAVANLVMADTNDWFKFTTTRKSASTDNVTLSFQHPQGDLDIRLYNSAGRLLRTSRGETNTEKLSLSNYAAGTYFVRVYGDRGAQNPSYSLAVNLGGTATPPPMADDSYENNDTLATARDLGALATASSFSNLVLADSHDWYRFSMNGAGTTTDFVSATFQNAQGNLDLELYNSSGTLLATALTSGNTEQISLAGRAAGTYYVHVFSAAGATNPSYALQIDPGVPVTPPPVDPPPTDPQPTDPPPTTGSFDIQFTFSGLTAAQQAIFEAAAQKWEAIIVGDLPNATYNGIAVDDVLIGASATMIDGVSGILGQAGPDRFRTSGTKLPYHGIMQFDSFDISNMQSNGTLQAVIEHEMGHVLGVGTLWSSKGLLTGSGTSDPLFIGAQAVAAYNALYGTNATGVPVENTGGSGTRNAHWRESIFRTELMTGWVGPGTNMPLSRITVASLADLGYTVNFAAADLFASSTGGASLASLGGAGGGGSGNLLTEFLLHETIPDSITARRDRNSSILLTDFTASSQRTHQQAIDAFFADYLSRTNDLLALQV